MTYFSFFIFQLLIRAMSSKLFNQFAKNIKPNFIKRYKRKLPKGVEIEDFFQEVFLIFWEKISQISKSKYAYFWKIADNLCVQVQQKTRNSVHLANTEENSGGGVVIYTIIIII